MRGMDIDGGAHAVPPMNNSPHHGHAMAAPEPRIRAAIPMTTVGGLEDAPLFAQALLERARALSTAPARETVVLVGHGAGDDSADAPWNALLQSLARQIRALGGHAFPTILTGTLSAYVPVRRARSALVSASGGAKE